MSYIPDTVADWRYRDGNWDTAASWRYRDGNWYDHNGVRMTSDNWHVVRAVHNWKTVERQQFIEECERVHGKTREV